MPAQHPPARDSRGHFVPLSTVPLHLDPDTWDDTCNHTTERTPTMTRELPHDPYITAAVDALTAAGLEPTTAETSDAESNRYDASGLTTQLDALLVWDGDHPALNAEAHEDGVVLLWEHPAEQWQWAPRRRHGGLENEPEFLPTLGRYADPAAIVPTVRALLAGLDVPTGHAPYWHPADAVRAAVAAWEADES